MIVGVQKAGTTSLKNYLNQHPEVLGHPQQEFAYFGDDMFYDGEYEKIFKNHFTVGNRSKAKINVAKNAFLYTSELGIQRLHKHNPHCKLIIILREPATRFLSCFYMEKFNGWFERELYDIYKVLDANNTDDLLYSYFINYGLYVNHVEMILKYFPINQIKFILHKELQENSEQICTEIFDWLQIDKNFKPKTNEIYNQTAKPKHIILSKLIKTLRNKNNYLKRIGKILLPYHTFTKTANFIVTKSKSKTKKISNDLEVVNFLKNFYKTYNEKLEKLINVDLKDWNN